MENQELSKKLFKISEITDQLINENILLKKELENKDKLIKEAILELEQKEEQLKNFHNQLNITKLAKGITENDDEKKALKLEINAIIREIDKCLAYLHDN